jgi:hypothetical protein
MMAAATAAPIATCHASGTSVIGGLALNWLVPLPFLPVDLPAGWLGAMV